MDIEWNAFTPGAARIGGALIGVATIDKRLMPWKHHVRRVGAWRASPDRP